MKQWNYGTMDRVLIKFIYLLIPLMIGFYHHDSIARPDGPPLRQVNLSHVKNVIPKWEPYSRYGNKPIYYVKHHYYRVMRDSHGYRETGIASWYGRKFHKHRTSNGEVYNMFQMTAAHKSLPLPTYVRVKNLDNDREIIVRVNDRGPFLQDRIIDLSYVAAKKLGMLKNGTAHVELTAIETRPYKQPLYADEADDEEFAQSSDSYSQAQQIFLQVGAFNNRENADYQATQISQITDSPVQMDTISTNRGTFYRVQVGPLDSLEMSERVQSKLEAAGLGNTIPSVQ